MAISLLGAHALLHVHAGAEDHDLDTAVLLAPLRVALFAWG